MEEMVKKPSVIPFTSIFVVILFFIGGCSAFRTKRTVNPATRDKIVAIALQYKGAPYRYRGQTPAGFDCSGYVRFVFKKAGFDIPRTSEQQYQSGYELARSDLKKGDLVFFTKWKSLNFLLSPNHVGIYIGNNRFIHAPSSGKTVRINNLNDVYWRSHYKGARNLLY